MPLAHRGPREMSDVSPQKWAKNEHWSGRCRGRSHVQWRSWDGVITSASPKREVVTDRTPKAWYHPSIAW